MYVSTRCRGIMSSMNKRNITILFLVVLVLGGLYFVFTKYEKKPYKIVTPDNYEAGTTVSLYKNIPPTFPTNIILEGKTLNYAGTVQGPDGKQKISVSYISNKSLEELSAMYSPSLEKVGWQISNKSESRLSISILAKKGENKLIVTAGQVKPGEVMVTFQYE